MALFQAGDTAPASTVTLTMTVGDEDWYKKALMQALFLLADPNNWDNLQGTLSVDECASIANGMIDTMVWS